MENSSKKDRQMSLMLILAAVDMLTAALVIGAVLMDVLIGGQKPESGHYSKQYAARALVEVVSYNEGSGVSLRGLQPVEENTIALSANDDRWDRWRPYLQGDSLRMNIKSYILNPGAREISLENTNLESVVIIHLGTGEEYDVVVRCKFADKEITVQLAPSLKILDSCEAQQRPVLNAEFSGQGDCFSKFVVPATSDATLDTISGPDRDWTIEREFPVSANLKEFVLSLVGNDDETYCGSGSFGSTVGVFGVKS